MRRTLLAVLFFVALVAIWAALGHPVILNEVKDLSKTLLVTLAMLTYATTSIVRSLAALGMTQQSTSFIIFSTPVHRGQANRPLLLVPTIPQDRKITREHLFSRAKLPRLDR